MVFRSRISVLLVLFMTAILGFCFVTTLPAGVVPTVLSLGPVVLLVVVLMASLRYVIDGNTLYVRTVPFTRGTAYDLKVTEHFANKNTAVVSSFVNAQNNARLRSGYAVGNITSSTGCVHR